MSGSVIENPIVSAFDLRQKHLLVDGQLRQLLGKVAELGFRQFDESPQLHHRGVVDLLAAGDFGREVFGVERPDGDVAALGQPVGTHLPCAIKSFVSVNHQA